MQRWLNLWRARREARVLARRAIPDELWDLTLARQPFLARRSADDLAALRRLTALFLDEKEFTGAGGLTVHDDMAVCIAAQACLPVLHLGLGLYRDFVGIVVHPDAVMARREVVDDAGVVHAYDEMLAGEAVAGGPVMLSWRDVDGFTDNTDAGAEVLSAYNVVLHEFVHVLDMAGGEADGMPPLATGAERAHWREVMAVAFDNFGSVLAHGEHSVIDPYGAEGFDEFFAVASEAFFVEPKALRAEQPDLYGLLAHYFKQDPAEFRPS